MKKILYWILGLRMCEHCYKAFFQGGYSWILQINNPSYGAITAEKKYYCNEHLPKFCVSLGIYNSHLKNTDNLEFERWPDGTFKQLVTSPPA